MTFSPPVNPPDLPDILDANLDEFANKLFANHGEIERLLGDDEGSEATATVAVEGTAALSIAATDGISVTFPALNLNRPIYVLSTARKASVTPSEYLNALASALSANEQFTASVSGTVLTLKSKVKNGDANTWKVTAQGVSAARIQTTNFSGGRVPSINAAAKGISSAHKDVASAFMALVQSSGKTLGEVAAAVNDPLLEMPPGGGPHPSGRPWGSLLSAAQRADSQRRDLMIYGVKMTPGPTAGDAAFASLLRLTKLPASTVLSKIEEERSKGYLLISTKYVEVTVSTDSCGLPLNEIRETFLNYGALPNADRVYIYWIGHPGLGTGSIASLSRHRIPNNIAVQALGATDNQLRSVGRIDLTEYIVNLVPDASLNRVKLALTAKEAEKLELPLPNDPFTGKPAVAANANRVLSPQELRSVRVSEMLQSAEELPLYTPPPTAYAQAQPRFPKSFSSQLNPLNQAVNPYEAARRAETPSDDKSEYREAANVFSDLYQDLSKDFSSVDEAITGIEASLSDADAFVSELEGITSASGGAQDYLDRISDQMQRWVDESIDELLNSEVFKRIFGPIKRMIDIVTGFLNGATQFIQRISAAIQRVLMMLVSVKRLVQRFLKVVDKITGNLLSCVLGPFGTDALANVIDAAKAAVARFFQAIQLFLTPLSLVLSLFFASICLARSAFTSLLGAAAAAVALAQSRSTAQSVKAGIAIGGGLAAAAGLITCGTSLNFRMPNFLRQLFEQLQRIVEAVQRLLGSINTAVQGILGLLADLTSFSFQSNSKLVDQCDDVTALKIQLGLNQRALKIGLAGVI